ncbi:putative exs family protein [Phaeoacremonium minimum UCRPA7]|uniref:Putative exs family protein n=1 Tax=Phaeoacremonium minimum (strain UCR-PA7) TaxID=1286976 RepID=R8BF35_PHAM7|nr:putative exs family protein [Phaeoacremonium minimum UCRPA7]EON97916.1 putative exs family protein [Phaeoacremonium minimum UCRPA7]
MDGDPAVAGELDSFSLSFPLPYRVAFIIIAAVWGWGMNLHFLYLVKIDVPSLIRYPQRSSSQQLPHHHSTYRLATALSLTFVFSIVTFWVFSHRDPKLVIYYDWMPMTYLVVLAALFVIPLRNFAISHGGRGRFLHALRRVSIGGLAQAQDGKFGDILLADVLTSYAKVLADLFVCICMFFTSDGSATNRPDRNCGGQVIVPLIMAVPSLIRFRQCLIEYVRVRNSPYKESVGWGGQHLANAAKYASAFPVIIFSALQRNLPADQDRTGLYRAWLIAVMVNSFYSFYWDVAKDWDLTLFSSAWERNNPEHALGLRRRIMLGRPKLYYCVIAMDLMLRCTWTLKLSPHLDHISDFESSLFVIEFLEVFRRWVWIFFRVETEWLRNSTSGLGVDDILLGDYQGKYDDED